MDTWSLGPDDGTLTIRTGVAGRAARMGHRLTLILRTWSATVEWTEGEPSAVHLSAQVDSLEVDSGEGGVTPLTGPEKAVARTNALKTLGASSFPSIEFRAEEITTETGGYRLRGPVTIHGTTRPAEVTVAVSPGETGQRIDAEATVAQTDYGVKPFSMMMGTMKVADAVTVALSATVSR